MAKTPAKTTAQINADAVLVGRAFQIKPLREENMPRGREKLHWVAPQDVYEDDLMDALQTAGEAKGLTPAGSFDVAIPTGFRSFPRVFQSQILPKIPKNLVKDAVAYKINFNRMSSGEDGEEIATVTIYKGPMPDAIRDQPVYARRKPRKKPVMASSPRKKPAPKNTAPSFNASASPAAPAAAAPQAAVIITPAAQEMEAPPRAVFVKKRPHPAF